MPDPSRRFDFFDTLDYIFRDLSRFLDDLLDDLLGGFRPTPGPNIGSVDPTQGHAGTRVVIRGSGFAPTREGNRVTFDGTVARVIAASATELSVIVEAGTDTGPVEVEVDGITDVGPDFTILPYPDARAGDDGPPIYFAGTGSPAASAGSVPSTGTAKILVALVNPDDRTPPSPVNLRQDIIDTWDDVTTFYDQASFGALTVDVDVMSAWHELSESESDYVKFNGEPGYPNIDWGVMDQLVAEAAQAATDDGFDLDDYDMMAVVVNLNGTFIRAWGGFSRQNFTYKDTSAGLDISITLDDPIPLLVVGEDADWGRCAHEFGHNLVDASGASITDAIGGVTLGEDVYSSDLIDPDEATADQFEMMGSHDDHPLFSGYYMEQLGWYDPAEPKHVRSLTWDRNPTTSSFKIVAHGLSKNTTADRCHLVKIRVTDGLYYYIEVRQRPGTTAQIFDDSIPLGTAPNAGGVVVTRVLTDEVNLNQQTRFITLLHETRVLKSGESAVDPARALVITVENDGLVNRPLVCEVKVEWAQEISDDADGKFDVRLDPWDSSWQTPDIWVDRQAFGSFDQAKDADGRPQGNGDKPRPGEINRFYARVHNDGADPTTNVKVTFYAVEPPGVGDNGSWAPLKTETIGNLAANDFEDLYVNWVPVVDRHTCLKVFAQQQLGEITGGNNQAQENVFDFEAPASSVPEAVTMPVAVRNPLDRRVIVHLRPSRVPAGYAVHFPHRWVWMEPKGERTFAMTVIPTEDYGWYLEVQRKSPATAIALRGDVPRGYAEPVGGTHPASWAFPIGGVTMRVTPKRRVEIQIEADAEGDGVHVHGTMKPGLAGERVRVELTDPYGYVHMARATTDPGGAFSLFLFLEKAAEEARALVDDDPEHLPPGHPGRFPVPGTYRVQAHTINSPGAAQASSNVIQVQLTGRERPAGSGPLEDA